MVLLRQPSRRSPPWRPRPRSRGKPEIRALVTGAAGFIGSHLCQRLVEEGHEVVGVDNFQDFYPRTMKEENLLELRKASNFRLLEGDLNELDLDGLLHDRDWIFHQAAQAGVRSSWGKYFEVYTSSNIAATQKLLEAAVNKPRLQRFVFASSSSVYGNAPRLPVTEEAPTNPISPYGVTKLAAEHLCVLYAHSFKVPTVSLRYFTVYGPRQRPDMAFHRFGRALLRGEGFRVYGNGSQTRDFTYVSDIVQANMDAAIAANVEGKVLNIAGGSRVSLTDAIAVLEELTGKEAVVRYEDQARGDVSDTYAEISLARRLIGYRPKVTLLEGLKSQLEYLRALYLPRESAPVR